MELLQLCKSVKAASSQIMNATTTQKNKVLESIAVQIEQHMDDILNENKKDVEEGIKNGMNQGLIDRMSLSKERLSQIVLGVRQVKELDDPIGEISSMKTTPNGLQIGTMRVALGVVGMIYEARPNVTVDAAILCLKAGNAVILRGSKDIFHSNLILVRLMKQSLKEHGMQTEIISMLEDTSRETCNEFMKMKDYLDVLIPRGGASLIKATVEQATVPVLETGTGNCHVYVDKDADLTKALAIIINAKTTRTSVCNACESVLFHRDIPDDFIKEVISALKQHQVKIHAEASICAFDKDCILATEEDYRKEYLDLEISMKKVDSLNSAIDHINTCSTHHSETIVSENYSSVRQFLKEVDSACVYANASTRFSDGFEFGLGAEIGISTQKLHARGPMGLHALTTQKFIVLGEGQVRE